MAVETSSSWPISTKAIWLDMGSVSWPLDWRQITDLPRCQLRYWARWICVHVCIYVCVPERACVYAGDWWTGRTEDGEIGGFTCVRACARPCLHACDPVCEAGMTDARWDRQMDGLMGGWIDRWIAKWMLGWTYIPAYMGTYQSC